MAARRNREIFHDNLARKKIQTTLLIKRLMDHINGQIELSPTQVKSVEILLKKVLPDLAAVEMKADASVTVTIRRLVADVEKPMIEGTATEVPALN